MEHLSLIIATTMLILDLLVVLLASPEVRNILWILWENSLKMTATNTTSQPLNNSGWGDFSGAQDSQPVDVSSSTTHNIFHKFSLNFHWNFDRRKILGLMPPIKDLWIWAQLEPLPLSQELPSLPVPLSYVTHDTSMTSLTRVREHWALLLVVWDNLLDPRSAPVHPWDNPKLTLTPAVVLEILARTSLYNPPPFNPSLCNPRVVWEWAWVWVWDNPKVVWEEVSVLHYDVIFVQWRHLTW